ncbi:TraE/TraK family type IV conjugative transfer system protein, partial [Vibrio rotiferianus]
IGNISPSRMDVVLQTMQRMIPAKNWDEVKEQMTAQLARLKIRKVEEKFSVKDVAIDPVTKVVWVTGEKETTSIRTGRSVSEMWTFEVRIDTNGVGSPVITHLKQYAGAPQKKRRAKELQKELPVAEQSTEQATQG